MSPVAEKMERDHCEKEQVREISVEVRPVLGDEEEADDGKETEEGDVEATHRKKRKREVTRGDGKMCHRPMSYPFSDVASD